MSNFGKKNISLLRENIVELPSNNFKTIKKSLEYFKRNSKIYFLRNQEN
jgi:hypothetical protein